MDIKMEKLKRRGRPRTNDPKIKFDNVRVKTSTIIAIEVIAEKLKVTPSLFIQTLLDSEVKKYQKFLKIED